VKIVHVESQLRLQSVAHVSETGSRAEDLSGSDEAEDEATES